MKFLRFFALFFIFLKAYSFALNWKTYSVTYSFDPEYKKGPKIVGKWQGKNDHFFVTKTISVKIPGDMKKGEVIKGVMAYNHLLTKFAHKNRIAMYDHQGNLPYGGPHRTMLKELGKLSGHPEVEHAGAILLGTSNGGRYAAHFAHFWPERTIAVILDHSWTTGFPMKRAKVYSYGQLPMARGVPYFFNSSKTDTTEGFNRRLLHYNWCKKAYRSKQPCTSIISWEDVGHGDVRDRSLQAAWLEDLLKFRVPEKIPADGKPYNLIPVDPRKMGGKISVKIKTDGKISYYTNIKVGPKVSSPTFWMPGAKSGALAVEWLKKNNGKILQDDSAKIK